MQQPIYPAGTVTALLETEFVTLQTRQVLQQRLATAPVIDPLFFSVKEFEIVTVVCNVLIPQQRKERVDIAGQLDKQLADNKGNGWRYNCMPPDQEAFKQGVKGINETAEKLYGKAFINLLEIERHTVVTTIQEGNAIGEVWQKMPGKLFFEELLSRVVEIYYSHPIAKEEIGDISFADAQGWQHIGLNQTDPQESLPIGERHT